MNICSLAVTSARHTSVHKEKVNAKLLGLGSHTGSEGDDITPVSAIVGLREVTLQPSVCVCLCSIDINNLVYLPIKALRRQPNLPYARN